MGLWLPGTDWLAATACLLTVRLRSDVSRGLAPSLGALSQRLVLASVGYESSCRMLAPEPEAGNMAS